ncbi:MAG: hypothetical protein PHE50_00760 [Dehalococcoidales bacterium]|nr:hypothetical protein [Dehalococcoidales bacterium]
MSRTKYLSYALVAALLIGIVYIGMGYFKAVKTQNDLKSQNETALHLLGLVPKPAADLEQRLAAAQHDNAAAKASILPAKSDTTRIITDILSAGDSAGVKVLPLTTDQWRTTGVNGQNYRVLDINITVEGELAQVKNFIELLYGSSFNTVAIGGFNFSRMAPPSTAIQGEVQVTVFTLPEVAGVSP